MLTVLLGAGGAHAADDPKTVGGQGMHRFIDDARVASTVQDLVDDQGFETAVRARQGVAQVAAFWRQADGTPEEFTAFCKDQFLSDPAKLAALLERFETSLEALSGHGVALIRALREPVDLDRLEPLPVDLLLATLNPFDHLSDDVFKTRVAFVALLNYPVVRAENATDMPRRAWAAMRLTGAFALRIPGEVRQQVTAAYAKAEDYIANYNIHMKDLVTADGRRPFPENLVLISHWGLRDHIKSLYSDARKNLEDQRLIYQVMQRIVRQEIPSVVINNPDVDWDPVTNQVKARAINGPTPSAAREADVRFARLLDVFHAERRQDGYSPLFPTHIDRKFGYEREIPEATVEGLLKGILSDPVAKDVAKLIVSRLGRPLEPFDIWFDGFKARSHFDGAALDARVTSRYPTLAAYQADLPKILGQLGFADDTAKFLSEHIVVDPSRGAGHAMGAGMRTDSAHLRTRVPKGGMNYKGFNIAAHELGHCVEQVFTLNKVDSTLVQGVPNTAFTEAFAFLFQERDLEILGLGQRDDLTRALSAVDTYWMTFEIAGVGVLDMETWRWMYAHPDATPAALREAVLAKAIEIWNTYYAPVLGVRDSPILAIYSHMISNGLYLPDYPIGHLIQFQMERQIEGKNLAAEMERMCVQGRLTPDKWMRGAVGGPLSTKPLVEAAKAGLKVIAKQK
jgi:hypothetical protein